MRGRGSSWTRLLGIVLVLGGLVSAIGLPAGALADTTYLTCPDYGTFRSDVQGATSNTTFTFPADCSYGATVVTSTITVPADISVTILGNGLTLTPGTGTFAVFTLNSGTSLTLDQTALTNPYDGIGYAGDFAKGGSVTLTHSIITGTGHTGIVAGGPVALITSTVYGGKNYGIGTSGSPVTLTNSTVSGGANSGVIANGTIALTDSTVSGSGSEGVNASGDVTLSTSTVTGISQTGEAVHAGGNALLINSTISDSGGGLDAVLDATLINSTVTGTAGLGVSAGDDVTLIMSTITDTGSAIFTPGSVTMAASILADKVGENCAAAGTLVDNGYNLSTDSSCTFTSATSKSNVTDAQLGLGSLGNNGGPTETIPLLPQSVAIDAVPFNGSHQCLDANGNVILDAAGNPITMDERGVARPQGVGCDIGAYEAAVPLSTSNTAVEILTQGNPAIRAQLFTGAHGGIPFGYITWSSSSVRFLVMVATGLTQTGPQQAVLYGSGLLSTGRWVSWRLDINGNTPKRVQLRLSNGYDSGILHIYGFVDVANTAQ